jgi:hypothetical protein
MESWPKIGLRVVLCNCEQSPAPTGEVVAVNQDNRTATVAWDRRVTDVSFDDLTDYEGQYEEEA